MSDSPKDFPSHFALRGGGTLVALSTRMGERPRILYAGPDIDGVEPAEFEQLATRQHAPGTPAIPLEGSLLNEMGTGMPSTPGLIAHRAGKFWVINLVLESLEYESECTISIHCRDAKTQVASRHRLAIAPSTGVLTCSTQIENCGETQLEVQSCAALCVPLDPRFDRVINTAGRWSAEFAMEEVALFQGVITRENRSGRTSHSAFPGGFAKTPETIEHSGLALGYHLAWSGNHRSQIECTADGRTFLQMGELLLPGEIELHKDEFYQTPDMLLAWSEQGLNGVSQALHSHLSDVILDPRSQARPRLVHYNTWEAVYFDHDEATLINLVEKAAEVGAERFVLDDGWFGSRRNDRSGLGDWYVSSDIYQGNLSPLVDAVRTHGMEFGLWFEPEMVNPDSDLFRAHPDWVLGMDGVKPIPSRNQLTLDLTRKEVCEYLFERIAALVSEYAIDYVKWDMNRDTHFPGSEGRAVMHRQTQALYALFERIRTTHPGLEIESCASGGGRADFGILRHADRIWTSDNNDARARQKIMRGASHFLPLRVLGNHVGPKTCHVTGRTFTMAFRVASSLLGHMGLELDLREESEADLEMLKAGIALHKQHRSLIHNGRFVRLTCDASVNAMGCVAEDCSEALFSYAKLEEETATLPSRLRFSQLNPDAHYRLRIVWPPINPAISSPSIVEAAELFEDGALFNGAVLMQHGIQPPLIHPDTALIYHLQAER